MSDHLGTIGTLADPGVTIVSLGREDYIQNRSLYPIRAVLTTDADLCASLELDWHRFAGSVNAEGFSGGLSRRVTVRHRDSARMVALVQSDTGTGAFSVRVPANLTLDLHIRAEPGDGCDLYLQERTAVDD